MTNIEARKKAREDIIRTLKQAGLREGISLSNEQLLDTRDTTFWHGVVRNEIVRAKDNYLTWNIAGSSASVRADNNAFLREITIAIDIFSKRSFDSEQNHKLLERIENQFTKDGYEVEFADEFFESDTSLFHYPITIFKLYANE